MRCLRSFAGAAAPLDGVVGWSGSSNVRQPAAAQGASSCHRDTAVPSTSQPFPVSTSRTASTNGAGHSQTAQPSPAAPSSSGGWHRAGSMYPTRSSLSSWKPVTASHQLQCQPQRRQHQTHASSDAAGSAAGTPAQGASIDPKEAAKFAALADSWWRADGPFAPLHALNPTRVRFMRDAACDALGLDHDAPEPFTGACARVCACAARGAWGTHAAASDGDMHACRHRRYALCAA